MAVEVEILGLEELMKNLDRAPKVVTSHIKKGMKDAAEEIANTKGVRRYPPAGSANSPPAPYYKRGRGLVQRNGGIRLTSERLGTQFYSKAWVSGGDAYGLLGQRASYGRYVVGDRQPPHMAQKGWRKLEDVAIEKQYKIRDILEFYVARAMKFVHLRP